MNKKKLLGLLALLGTFSLALAGCEADVLKDENIPAGTTTSTDATGETVSTTSESAENEVEEAPTVSEKNTISVTVESNTELGTGEYTVENNIYTITKAGEYTFTGELSEGSIVVNAEEAEVIINLNGVNISSAATSPINIIAAGDVEISAKSDSVNYITDNRTTASDEDPTAAIYSTSDLKIKGKGELYVFGNYNNGIHTKDDLTIKNLNLYVKAVNNAIKGNDSVEIENAIATVISTGGDGIKTTNSDISDKGNQRGSIVILGSTVISVYACCDGLDAAYDVEIKADDEGNEPELNVFTSTYSSYSDDSPTTNSSSSTLYLKLSSNYYSTNYQYYAYCYDSNNSENGDWVEFSYYQTTSSGMGFGGRSSSYYYYLKSDVDTSNYSGIQIYMFTKGSTPSTTSYYARSSSQNINSSMDMLTVSSVSTASKVINVDWSTYSSASTTSMGPGGMGGMNQGNTEKTDYSTKGIKADNQITISAGTIVIKAYDDGLHATSNVTLENGSTSVGNINISGGSISILSKDDGAHADGTLTVSGGSINVSSSYEGLEGTYIIISGGNHYVYATDDGLNSQTALKITGGVTAVLVASGDTDAIDSNGTYTQTGGVVIAMNMQSNGTASILDCDSTVKITGGTFLGFGNMESKPSVSNVKSTSKSVSMSKGTYSLTYNDETLASFELKTSYSSFTLIGASGTYKVGSTSVSL